MKRLFHMAWPSSKGLSAPSSKGSADGRSVVTCVCLLKAVRGVKERGEGGSDGRPPACNYDGYRVNVVLSYPVLPRRHPIKGRNESSCDMNTTVTGVATRQAVFKDI